MRIAENQWRERLTNELRSSGSRSRAASAIRRFVGRELLGITSAEFVQGVPPDRIAGQLSELTDAVLAAALDFTIQQTAERWPLPQRVDGSQPQYAIVASGTYGGAEIGYSSPLDLLLLCDQIDRKNESHVRFNAQIAAGWLALLDASRGRAFASELRFQHPAEPSSPRPEFHAAAEAVARYEREDHAFQRLAFVKARVVAGDDSLGRWFLQQISPWRAVPLLDEDEITDFRVLYQKLAARPTSRSPRRGVPITDIAGGRRDIQRTIQFLQLLHGGQLPDVRVVGTLDAISALLRHGLLSEPDASALAENLARLCRLEHHLARLPGHRDTRLPDDEATRTRLAWRLGVRLAPDDGNIPSAEAVPRGDLQRFEKLLADTLAANRTIIQRLMIAAAADLKIDPELDELAIETELILDPDRDLETYRSVMREHGFSQCDLAIEHCSALAVETVAFLSSRRCRHRFAAVAPRLLRAIATTPAPQQTLARLVAISDAIGAKATLWELLGRNHALLRLLVRLCSLSTYLTDILIRNPGMLDELIDSLAMDCLPRAERLDMQAIRLCQSAQDLPPILRSFQAGCHLMVGVRDVLDEENVGAIGEALSDAAEVILQRLIQSEHERLAALFGDPVDAEGNAVELVAVALEDFAYRELHYRSDLALAFLYTAEGQTQRRAGGPRSTLPHHRFFNQLAENVIRQLDSEPHRLYRVRTPLSAAAGTARSQSIQAFVNSFGDGNAPLWLRAALCRSRPCCGSRQAIEAVRAALVQVIAQSHWPQSDDDQLQRLRRHSESAAAPDDLLLGSGGAAEVQLIVAAGILKSSTANAAAPATGALSAAGALSATGALAATGVAAALADLAAAGVYSSTDTETLASNYLYLRRVYAKLGLLNATAEHEQTAFADCGTDGSSMAKLAELLGESDPHAVTRRCEVARRENRELFERLLTP